MNQHESREDLEVERLIRAHLERCSEAIDPRPLFGKIQQSLPLPSPGRRPEVERSGSTRAAWKWAGVAASAALVITGLVLLVHDRPALAKGETVVREARQAHLLPIDRCYLV